MIPYTLYNISIVSNNKYGQSLPSYYLLVLTLSQEEARKVRDKKAKDKLRGDSSIEEVSFTTPASNRVPDFKQCCRNIKNTTIHEPCIEKFCDPLAIQDVQIVDFMICASWTWDMLNCMVDGKNHEPCCKSKGVPDVCSNFCAGDVSAETLSHKHFK